MIRSNNNDNNNIINKSLRAVLRRSYQHYTTGKSPEITCGFSKIRFKIIRNLKINEKYEINANFCGKMYHFSHSTREYKKYCISYA